ncbi:MAG: T9SS type A sorting domain-containing protein [Bacteroidetes bacterium]|nr:T9SS type A sorting domain-containing protein [Bacteroidota bacterium]
MKHKLLLTVAVLGGLTSLAQNKGTQHGVTNHFASQAPSVYLSKLKNENNISKASQPQTITNSPLASTMAVPSWSAVTTSNNIYGVLIDGQKTLHYNPYVKTVSYIHRKGPGFTASPANNSGAIIAHITTNGGAAWDSTCFWSDGTSPGRYPQGAIYSAPGNTLLSNAYVVGSGIVTDGTNWIGSWVASKQLGAGNYNNTASAAPNAMQVLSNTAPYPSTDKMDYAAYSFATTNDGKVRTIGYICEDINAVSIGLRGFRIATGTFNAGVFNWTGDSIIPTTELRTDNSKHLGFMPVMAWSQDGMTGYAIAVGVKAGTIGSNRGYQPIIYKTINGGTSWALLSGIDFSVPTYSTILKRLEPVAGSTVVVPSVNTAEGFDATVDMNGNLHMACVLNSSSNTNIDSLDYTQTFTPENYSWDFTPGKKPYLYDFYGNGTSAWKYLTIDSLTSEGPSDISTNPGYLDNPWDIDAGSKVRSGSRIQLSRTPDGKFIIYTWAESNPAFTIGGKNWNNIPEVKTRLVEITGSLYSISPTKVNVTPIGTPVNTKAMFHFSAPVVSAQTYTSSTSVTFTLPVAVVNSNPYSQLTANTHWYSNANLNFVLPIPTEVKVNANETNDASVYPNPTNESTTLTIDLKENTLVEISIFNIIGKEVKKVSSNCNVGSNNIHLEMTGFSKGIYLLNIKAGNTVTTKKVVVQ